MGNSRGSGRRHDANSFSVQRQIGIFETVCVAVKLIVIDSCALLGEQIGNVGVG